MAQNLCGRCFRGGRAGNGAGEKLLHEADHVLAVSLTNRDFTAQGDSG